MDRPINAAPVRALSAIGSATFPTSVTSPRLRARSPSTRSVIVATAKTTKAQILQPDEASAAEATEPAEPVEPQPGEAQPEGEGETGPPDPEQADGDA